VNRTQRLMQAAYDAACTLQDALDIRSVIVRPSTHGSLIVITQVHVLRIRSHCKITLLIHEGDWHGKQSILCTAAAPQGAPQGHDRTFKLNRLNLSAWLGLPHRVLHHKNRTHAEPKTLGKLVDEARAQTLLDQGLFQPYGDRGVLLSIPLGKPSSHPDDTSRNNNPRQRIKVFEDPRQVASWTYCTVKHNGRDLSSPHEFFHSKAQALRAAAHYIIKHKDTEGRPDLHPSDPNDPHIALALELAFQDDHDTASPSGGPRRSVEARLYTRDGHHIEWRDMPRPTMRTRLSSEHIAEALQFKPQ